MLLSLQPKSAVWSGLAGGGGGGGALRLWTQVQLAGRRPFASCSVGAASARGFPKGHVVTRGDGHQTHQNPPLLYRKLRYLRPLQTAQSCLRFLPPTPAIICLKYLQSYCAKYSFLFYIFNYSVKLREVGKWLLSTALCRAIRWRSISWSRRDTIAKSLFFAGFNMGLKSSSRDH